MWECANDEYGAPRLAVRDLKMEIFAKDLPTVLCGRANNTPCADLRHGGTLPNWKAPSNVLHKSFCLPKNVTSIRIFESFHSLNRSQSTRLRVDVEVLIRMTDTISEKTLFGRASEPAKLLQDQLPDELRTPKVAIVCGSGLGGLQHTINAGARFEKAYADIPNWAKSTGKSITRIHVCMHDEADRFHDGSSGP